MKHLDPRTMHVYWYVRACIKQQGFAPTLRQIGTALGFASTSTASAHVARLVKAGKLTKQRYGARALGLPKKVKPPTLDEQASDFLGAGNILRWDVDANGKPVAFTVIAAGVGVVTTVEAQR